MGRAVAAAAALVTSIALTSCTSDAPAPAGEAQRSQAPSPTRAGPSPSPPESPASLTSATPAGPTGPSPLTEPGSFDAAAAMRSVRLLAGEIGPRLATGRAFRRAGSVVEARFEKLGYAVRREVFEAPAGDSWGVAVEAGRSFNVIAEPPRFDPSLPYLVLGAHLDTVAVAPGAEDNASGVAVLLEVARLAAAHETRLPAVLIAFGAEEPRGPGDDMHHFGSRQHVRGLTRARRDNLDAMVSLDRVGVGRVVPVCTGPLSPPRVQRELLAAGRRTGVPTARCENTASDHWSFEKAGFAVARLGGTSYAAYHSADDVPAVVSERQLGRTGRLVWAWLR